jgi:hypothetical protein
MGVEERREVLGKYRESIGEGGTTSERNDLLMPIYDWQQIHRLVGQVPRPWPTGNFCQLYGARMLQY